ncbi:hypothetical protein NDU88_002464 [Pleurodeles waltl]|uniref:Uncharacterized protein n=1 Tax=Pleurodeles waltl TaxID=8319 RepID=A0AAV7UVT6_PLEWA|nr:hypothetical protein NDU88_002464 [Pleurodeles waltl]
MVECTGGALKSVMLLRCDSKKNQEGNARPPEETCAQKEDVEDERRKKDQTATTGDASKRNEEKTLESPTPEKADQLDDNGRADIKQDRKQGMGLGQVRAQDAGDTVGNKEPEGQLVTDQAT